MLNGSEHELKHRFVSFKFHEALKIMPNIILDRVLCGLKIKRGVFGNKNGIIRSPNYLCRFLGYEVKTDCFVKGIYFITFFF